MPFDVQVPTSERPPVEFYPVLKQSKNSETDIWLKSLVTLKLDLVEIEWKWLTIYY